MTEGIKIALIAAIPATGALIVSIINSIKANKIHILVNSNLTKIKNDLAAANRTIKRMIKAKLKP